MNSRVLTKAIKTLKVNEEIYINAINLTPSAFKNLKKLIQNGILTPKEKEVKTLYKDIESVMKGKTILPQMTYIKTKEEKS